MARINSNVGAVIAQRQLGGSYRSLNNTLSKLSTGLRINRGKDDPAGLIISERLRAEIGAVNQAIRNTQRASNIIATTEGALDEVANLLRDIQGLVIEAANEGALSEEEIAANQLQIDSAIESITRISNSTTFGGKQLLNGSLDYITSGVTTSQLASVQIRGAQFGTRTSIPVEIDVTQSALPARLTYPLSNTGAGTVTIEVQGNDGVTTLSFASNTPVSTVVEAINSVSDSTGVRATQSGAAFYVESVGLGSRQFVSIKALTGNFVVEDTGGNPSVRQVGRDARATLNGALTTGDGNRLTLKTSTLDIEVRLDDNFGTGTTTFDITDGGALFQVGPQVNTNLQVGLGVQSVAASRLGNAEVGFLSQIQTGQSFSLSSGNFLDAQKVLEDAIKQVAVMRGRLGAFEKNSLDTNVSQLSITMENLTSSESAIRDADFAAETSQLARNQVLVSSGTTVLGIANQTPASVLQLLGG
ncbi:MAG: flagellin [Phycisphaerae bacterium]|nr:flagellin [Phycisphaerae bacterium]